MKLYARILSLLLVFATCFSLLTETVLGIDEPMYMPEETAVAETEAPELTPALADVQEPAETPAQTEESAEIPESETAEPVSSETPAETAEPEPSEAPAETAEPEPSEAPAETAEPDSSEAPAETTEPEIESTEAEETEQTDIASSDASATAELTAPELQTVEHTLSGVAITWKASEGAEKYRVFRKTANTGWTRVCDSVAGTSFMDTTAVSGTTYWYTVRCLNADGTAYTSGFDAEGLTITFFTAPEFSSINNTAAGMQVSWKAVSGANMYRLYRRVPGGSWEWLIDTADTSYTDTTAVSGSTYYYCLRCVNGERGPYLSAYRSSEEVRFIAAPEITSVSNLTHGISISWDAVPGAEQYCVFRKTEDSTWKSICNLTSKTTFVDTTAVSGTRYYYTVRCISADGSSYTSSHRAGTPITCVDTPELSAIANTANGVSLSWKKVSGAGSYRVYRKTEGGSWKYVTETTTTTFYDVTAPASTKVYYTVRALSADSSKCLSSFDAQGLGITTPAATYYNTPLKQTIPTLSGGSWKKVSSLWYYYVDGTPVKDGLYSIDGYNYYFNQSGAMQTGWVITSYKTADGKSHTARSYFTSDGHRKESGWGIRNSQWCYFVNGFTVVDCLYKISGVNYYFNADGIMQTGWVQTTAPDQDGKLTSVWSYFKSSGARVESDWLKVSGKWYYFVNGVALAGTDYAIDGTTYRFNDDCSMFSGWLDVTYTGADGKTHTGTRYYYNSSGARCENGIYKIGSYYYYFTDTILQYGWINTPEGDRLYAYDTGRLCSGWWKNGDYWYYFNANGKLATGWKSINGYTYYFYNGTEENGGPKWTMAVSTTIDGYTISSSGTATLPTKMKLLAEAQNHISSTPYLIIIDSVQCRLGIFTKTSSGGWEYYDYISCSPGKASTPTYKGVFSITYDRGYYFDSGSVRCYWYSTFNGNQAIHSVLYYPSGALADGRTGYRLSHGCVRVSYSYAKWIYYNIPVGTTTVVV
ncbi:MAG: L,D-transpeptidase family protein [Oscillospiraceae bacterium]